MSDFEVKPLCEVAHCRMGETILSKELDSTGYPIYSADSSSRPWGYKQEIGKILKRGCLVIGARGTIGNPRLPEDEKFGCTQTTIAITPKQEIYSYYLKLALEKSDIQSITVQQAVPMLTVGNIGQLPIPVPPVPEQIKIAEILSGIDRLIGIHSVKWQKMSDLLVAIRDGIFANVSGEEMSLGELCSLKQWQTISANQMTETGYPVYGANGQIGFYSEYNHKDPVLAVTCRGATCGNLNLIPGLSYVTGNSMCLDDLSKDISIQYLYHFLTWKGLGDVINGSAQPQITRTPLQAVQIVLPTKQRQSEVVSMLAAISTLHDYEREMMARLENLKEAVSIDLLSGRKRVTIQP